MATFRPDTARIEKGDDIVSVPLETVKVGDVIHLAAGARVPVGGVVMRGDGFVDEAMISGEPVLVEKAPGDPLVAGTVNGTAALVMEARAVDRDTMLSWIIAMGAQAQGARLPVQDLVNRITLWFVPAVMALAVLTVAVWLIVGSLPLALVAGISVLIIACPCAMGLATPTSIMVGTGRAAELGVLFRRGDAMQADQGVDVVAFDKTGTLTVGKPEVVSNTLSEADMNDVAAVDAASDHPLADTILAAAKGPLAQAQAVETIPGHGVIGQVGGRQIALGNAAMMARESVAVYAALPAGQTPVYVAIDGRFALGEGMNSKDASSRVGLPAKTIRYYEDIGLVTPDRAENGDWDVSDQHLHKLAFLARARGLGFSVADCRNLLALWEDQARASADVRAIAQDHLSEIEQKISALEEMRATLADLVSACAGDARPDCPIIERLHHGAD